MITRRVGTKRIIIMLVLLVGAGFFTVHAIAAERPHATVCLALASPVEIDSENVSLGQVARITGADAANGPQMAAVMIGRAPQAGHSRTISRDYILLRLRQSGFDTHAMRVQGPEQITLMRRAVTISAGDIEMMVRAHITEHPPFRDADLTISSVRVADDVMLPTGNVQHDIQYLPQKRLSGTLPLNIFFSVDGTPVKRVMVTAHVVMMKEVPVTRRPIARYELIQPEDLMMQTMDITDLQPNTVFSFQEIAGQRARRNIGPRTVLRKDQLEFPPAVKKGDRVLIVAESGGLRITTLGEVKSIGRPGERIRVVNLDSNKSLFARVIDARTVQVDF